MAYFPLPRSPTNLEKKMSYQNELEELQLASAKNA